MTKTFEFFWSDLTPECQERLFDFLGGENGNYDVIPFATFYFIDEIWKIINEWKKEAGVTSAILWKYDHKRNKICLYTTRPGYFIGEHGKLHNKYNAMLRQLNNEYVKNGVEFIECDEFINGD